MNQSGLGPALWWQEGEEDQEGEEGQEGDIKMDDAEE
jgi:DNA-directed RNA polymerase III subunit RPC8